ncbi:MAG: hypothetical protein EON59_05550 [Alphaproteobacteria bacterium]|nr:MAG: hypothetical protein EON59_05550 [Alphaproteobacteria bacterium]
MRAILVVTITALALAGCGVKSTVAPDAAAAAAALPAYAPAYPGAKAGAGTRTVIGDTTSTAVSLTTPDKTEQVMAFYKGKLATGGFGKVSEVNLGLGRMLVVQDVASGRGVQVMVMDKDGGTQIQITQTTVKPKG